MRLDILTNGRGLKPLQKLQLLPIEWLVGVKPPNFIILSYRRELFGQYFARFLQETMRQATEWRKGELELFAAFTAKQLACTY